MKTAVKSFIAAIFGAALFFSFFMMLSIPVMNIVARLHNSNAPLQAPDVVLGTGPAFRVVGLSLSAIAFAICFWLAMKKFRRASAAFPGAVPISRLQDVGEADQPGAQMVSKGHGLQRSGK